MSRSIPRTLCPISARQAELTQPTYPKPITITLRLLTMLSNLTSRETPYYKIEGNYGFQLRQSHSRGSWTAIMKILWICPFFLHSTDCGAQIRTLGTLKELHKRHEVHFATLNDPRNTEGPQRSPEYSSRHLFVEHSAPARRSLGILLQLVSSVWKTVPLAV